MQLTINSTSQYHKYDIDTLGWELTLCNALFNENSPCREILIKNSSYGNLLYDYLGSLLSFKSIRSIIEIGGGYGYLMKDFLARNSELKVSMLDISPFLLQKQRETLAEYNVSFIEEDFLETEEAVLASFDMAILNENLGDFPTVCKLSKESLSGSTINPDPLLNKIILLFDKYQFEIPDNDFFSFNAGAVLSLEKLCSSGISHIFLAEHSCEASVPEKFSGIIRIASSGTPERISLKGHDEYSIKFSHLQRVADYYNYKTVRGPAAGYLKFKLDKKIRFILSSNSTKSDEHEIIRQFVEDIYKYEYLLISKHTDHE